MFVGIMDGLVNQKEEVVTNGETVSVLSVDTIVVVVSVVVA